MAIRKFYRISGFVDFRDDGKFDAALCGDDAGMVIATSKGFSTYSAAESWLTGQIVGQAQDHMRNNKKVTGG